MLNGEKQQYELNDSNGETSVSICQATTIVTQISFWPYMYDTI